MMADWASALAGGIGAAATTGANLMGDQIKQQQALEAEQRAADIKLDLQQRMAAADEMARNRAADRFSAVVKQKMGEDVPVEAPGVDKTGITRAAGQAVGSVDVDGTQVTGSFNADPATLRQMLQNANRRLMDPASTDEQRTEARQLVTVLQKQVDAQAGINAQSVEGKTRKRTVDEASQAALDYALQNDASAYIAGSGMLAAAQKQDATSRALDLREKQIDERLAASKDRTDMMGQIAQIRADAARDAAEARAEAIRERATSGAISASTKTMLINSENANIKSATSEMNMLSRQMENLSSKDPARAQINARIGELRDEIKEAQANKNAYMRDLGILKPDGAKTTPPSAGETVGNPFAGNDPLGLFKK
jgi:hypothetical protein